MIDYDTSVLSHWKVIAFCLLRRGSFWEELNLASKKARFNFTLVTRSILFEDSFSFWQNKILSWDILCIENKSWVLLDLQNKNQSINKFVPGHYEPAKSFWKKALIRLNPYERITQSNIGLLFFVLGVDTNVHHFSKQLYLVHRFCLSREKRLNCKRTRVIFFTFVEIWENKIVLSIIFLLLFIIRIFIVLENEIFLLLLSLFGLLIRLFVFRIVIEGEKQLPFSGIIFLRRTPKIRFSWGKTYHIVLSPLHLMMGKRYTLVLPKFLNILLRIIIVKDIRTKFNSLKPAGYCIPA